ncbi:MAG TPA: hypothetical protein VE195_07565 [Acidobacteriaceae bacterium]|nr:hypothetical protein [Acidobacteriaceae bacterium]
MDADFGAVCGSPADLPCTRTHERSRFSWILALGGWMLLIPASLATAQSGGAAPGSAGSPATKTSTAKTPVHHAVHHHHHAKPKATTVAPVAPPPPLPPAQQPPNPATIDFSHGLLSVRAQNSSLVNILTQIQHQTGLVIDGLNHDQRVYGQYGPGSISATLSALLDGAGYDFVIVGGGSGHAAARLILSAPGSTGAPATTPPAVANNQAAPPAADANQNTPQPDANEDSSPPETNEPDANQDTSSPDASQDTIPPDANQDTTSPDAEQGGNSPNTDQADPSAPTQPKTPQEIFDELRRMHPQ